MKPSGILKTLAKQFIERAEAQGLSHTERHEFALEFFLGAASCASALGKKTVYDQIIFFSTFRLAPRGYCEVEALMKDKVA